MFVEMAQRGRGRRAIRGKSHNQHFDGELELYLPFGRNNDDNLNQRNKIKELSRQIATLIEEVLCILQLKVVIAPRMLKFNLSILLIL